MLHRFKVKMLISIIILAAVVFSVRSQQYTEVLIPVLQYVMRDSGLEQTTLRFVDQYTQNRFFEPLPVMKEKVPLQLPCQFSQILQPYGWSWDPVNNTQVFHPGIKLQVQENTLVQAIAGGQVTAVEEKEDGYAITVQHNDNFFSYYSGLKEALVETNTNLSLVKPIGRSRDILYFELRDKEGPIDPQTVFQKK